MNLMDDGQGILFVYDFNLDIIKICYLIILKI